MKNLTQAEADCLFYLLQGKPAKKIASSLYKSTKTIEFYINNIRIKWECANKSEIFDKCFELGYLKISPSLIEDYPLLSNHYNN